jgi:tetratricopeptide (TPR) repeat protein
MRLRVLLISLTSLAGVSGVWGQTETVFVISGEVRLEDGTAPPDAVQIDRVCSGRTVSMTKTDTLGHFSYSVDTGHNTSANTSPNADAGGQTAQAWDLNKPLNQTSSQYTNPISAALRDCEIQATLSGFQTASVRLAVHDTSDDGRVGTLVLHPMSRSSALTVSATTASAPPTAMKAYERGMESIGKEKWDVAESELAKAVKIYPRFAVAWYQLGVVRQKRNVPNGAIEAWQEALKQDARYVKPYESLATLADQQADWTAAEQYSRQLLQLDADDFPAAYLINAVANARLNRVEAAELAARDGLRVDKDRRVPRLDYVLGLILMQKQQYAESAQFLRAYLELAPNSRDAATVRDQIARLEQQR